MPPVL
ncbi:hemolysin, partial [Yersinia pestis PY-13]|jgi:hypothetical protein